MNDRRKRESEYDRIAASRISKIGGGLDFHVALGRSPSITLRNKMKRMGLQGAHVEAALKMVDEMGIQQTLETQPLGVRFATVSQAKSKPKVWRS